MCVPWDALEHPPPPRLHINKRRAFFANKREGKVLKFRTRAAKVLRTNTSNFKPQTDTADKTANYLASEWPKGPIQRCDER